MNEKINIIFLGLMYCDESLREAEKYSKCGLQMAPHVFQTNLLRGFMMQNNIKLKVINFPPIGSYLLNYKKLFINEYHWGEDNIQPSYLNLPYIKHKMQARKIVSIVEDENIDDEDTFLILYTMHYPFLKAAEKLKKKHPRLKICTIQTDPVPGRGDLKQYMSAAAVKKGNHLVQLAKCCDSFVVLTKYLAEAMECNGRPFAVIECIIDDKQEIIENEAKTDPLICLYTGTTHREFGIKELTEAFTLLPDAELWICGQGDSDEYLKEMDLKYDNIRFFGFIKYEEVKEYRKQANFLINPRRPTGTFTKYSFPSKTAEYLMSGIPTIMYKLEGLPDEYDKYINYLSGMEREGIAHQLSLVFQEDYDGLQEKAKMGRRFMLSNKNPKSQAERIVRLMNGNV